MHRLKFTWLTVLLCICLQGWSVQLSSAARLAVLTCAPGTEIYSAYGHTAIRVNDPIQQLDVVYNYGIFDSYEEQFALKFARGQLDYQLGTESFAQFLGQYHYFGRGVAEQTLDLTPAQMQAVVDFLEWNNLPENRTYRYHFFFDNCSSRVLDVLRAELGDDLELAPEGAPTMERGRTFRHLIDDYQRVIPWTDLGIDLVLGMPCDSVVKVHQEAFLPDFLLDELSVAQVNGHPLVKSTREILPQRAGVPERGPSPTAVLWIVCSVLVLLMSITALRAPKWMRILSAVVLTIFAVLGVVLLLMWVATDHDTTVRNWNLMLAPLTLVLLLVPALRRTVRWVHTGIATLFLLGWAFWPQQLHPATIPLALLLLAALIAPMWTARKTAG